MSWVRGRDFHVGPRLERKRNRRLTVTLMRLEPVSEIRGGKKSTRVVRYKWVAA